MDYIKVSRTTIRSRQIHKRDKFEIDLHSSPSTYCPNYPNLLVHINQKGILKYIWTVKVVDWRYLASPLETLQTYHCYTVSMIIEI